MPRKRWEYLMDLGIVTMTIAAVIMLFVGPMVFFWSEFAPMLFIPLVVALIAVILMSIGAVIERFNL